MSALLYVYQGIVLVVALLSPTKRKLTFERWKKTKSHKLVYEIGFGMIGLMILAGPLLYVLPIFTLLLLKLLEWVLP